MTLLRWMSTLTLAGSLLACGTSPSASPRPPRPTPLAPAQPMPPQPAAPMPELELPRQSFAAFQAMRGYEAQLRYFQKQGAKTSTGLYQIAGRAPRKLRIEIKQGTGEGAKLLWEGGQTLRVRAGGLLGAIALSLPLDDKRFVSVRNYTLDQTDIHSMYRMMLDPAHQLMPIGPGMVAVTGPNLLNGCVRMVVRFDPVSSLPTTVEMSDAREVVFRMQLSNFHRNDQVSMDI